MRPFGTFLAAAETVAAVGDAASAASAVAIVADSLEIGPLVVVEPVSSSVSEAGSD